MAMYHTILIAIESIVIITTIILTCYHYKYWFSMVVCWCCSADGIYSQEQISRGREEDDGAS